MTARQAPAHLRRSIGLPMLVLYGTGVTIGAGIYVLVGETVARAGNHAPASFLLSAVVMGFTAGTFAELSARVPKAAGEAVYVQAGFARPWLTLAVGLAVLVEAMIAAAAISLGCAGYLGQIVPLPGPVLVTAVVGAMAFIAAWGIRESVAIAGVMTLVEVAGLLAIVAAGFWLDPGMIVHLPATLVPPLGDGTAVAGVLSASLIAFFAFIGFDDIVNLVEEARDPQRALPRAIGVTLALVTLIYVLVSFVAVRMIPAADLAGSPAPVSLMFERLTGVPPLVITLIAVMATMNGVVIIIIMAARVTYGLAQEGRLPAWMGRVSPTTRTPLTATAMVAALVLAMALFAPLDVLAETTSQVMLSVFVMVNLSLLMLKLRRRPPPPGALTVPVWVPACGAASCLALLLAASFGGS